MTRLSPNLAIGGFCSLLFAAAACSSSNSVKAGAPQLLSFSVVAADGSPVELVTEAGVTPVPPLSHFVALFDRLLDPTALEDLDPDAGTTSPKDGVALVESGTATVPATTLYVPNGDAVFTLLYPPGPSITITPLQGLPSGSPVTVALVPSKVRSHDQTKPFEAAPGVNAILAFDTEPLSATISVPEPPPPADAGADESDAGVSVAADVVVKVAFNNLTADATASAIQVSATVAGVPTTLEVTVSRDAENPVGWTVAPPAEGWPPGAIVTVTVDAAAADNFGMTLGTAVTATFMVMQ